MPRASSTSANNGKPADSRCTTSAAESGPSGSLHNMPEVTLNLPGRDQKIEEYLNYIRYLGKAGIPYSTYAHMGNGIWSSGRTMSARGYCARDGDSKSPDWKGNWAGKDVYGAPVARPRFHARRRSGRTTPTSSRKWSRWRKRRVCESASIRMTRHSQCWRVCRDASSAISKVTRRRLRSPTVPTSASAYAWGRGSRAVRR